MPDTDAELVRQTLDGSEAACHALVSRYSAAAVNVAARLVNDRAVAEELAQDAFVRAISRLETFDPARRFSAWFFKVLHNVVVDYLRRRRVQTVSLDALEAEGRRVAVADAGHSPEDEAERRELATALAAALGRIRPEYREAIVLRHVQGLTVDEIAGILDVPTGTVKTYLHRGRRELSAMLAAAGWTP